VNIDGHIWRAVADLKAPPSSFVRLYSASGCSPARGSGKIMASHAQPALLTASTHARKPVLIGALKIVSTETARLAGVKKL
jgi:hypothetical protein